MDGQPEQSFEDSEAASVVAGQPASAGMAAEAGGGPRAVARLVEYRPGGRIALPPHTTYALIERPEPVAVPGAAGYAYGLIVWQGMRLPLIDLNILLHGPGLALAFLPLYALIVAYQRAPGRALEYGAIGTDVLPQTVEVGDDAQCELPADSALWRRLAQSCFLHEGQATPILDTSRLFATAHA